MGLFARDQPDMPGELAVQAFSFEHYEIAAYELLRRVAQRAGDSETVQVAKRILDEERRPPRRCPPGSTAPSSSPSRRRR